MTPTKPRGYVVMSECPAIAIGGITPLRCYASIFSWRISSSASYPRILSPVPVPRSEVPVDGTSYLRSHVLITRTNCTQIRVPLRVRYSLSVDVIYGSRSHVSEGILVGFV